MAEEITQLAHQLSAIRDQREAAFRAQFEDLHVERLREEIVKLGETPCR